SCGGRVALSGASGSGWPAVDTSSPGAGPCEVAVSSVRGKGVISSISRSHCSRPGAAPGGGGGCGNHGTILRRLRGLACQQVKTGGRCRQEGGGSDRPLARISWQSGHSRDAALVDRASRRGLLEGRG